MRKETILLFVVLLIIGRESLALNETTKKGESKVNEEIIDQYFIDNYGIGVGLFVGAVGLGIRTQYNYNFHDDFRSQLNISASVSEDSKDNIFGMKIIETRQFTFSTTYRKLFKVGVFIGAGFSYLQSEVVYNNIITEDKNSDYNRQRFKYYASNLDLEVGWQGNEGYYFTVGLRLGITLSKKEEYYSKQGLEKISSNGRFGNIQEESEHRSQTEELYKSSKNPSRIFVGFAWYLKKSSD